MAMIRCALLAFALTFFGQVLPVFGQVPPPVPPIADTDRIQTYNITSSTSQVQVGFPVFGDCTDITVTIAGVTLPPSTSGLWNCASLSGSPLNTLPLPITDMVVNFTPPLTSGSVTITGAWHPRNLTVPTASGISRREYEQTFSTLVSSQRELFYELNTFLLASAPQGSLLYRGPGGWAPLPQGSIGTALISNGPSALPTWLGIQGLNGGTVTSVSTGAGLTGGPCIVICTISVTTAAANTIKSNITGSTAVPSDNTVDAILDSKFGSTTGKIIYRGASTWTAVAPGTVGQVLALSGSPLIPTWISISNRIAAGSVTAGNSATLTDTTSITSTYSRYEIVLDNIIPATNSTSCAIQISSNGVFKTTSYQTAQNIQDTAGNRTPTGVSTFLPCSEPLSSSNSPPGISATIKISNPSDTTMPKMVSIDSHLTAAGGSPVTSTSTGYWAGGNGAIDGIRLFFSSGNITSGTMTIYGLN